MHISHIRLKNWRNFLAAEADLGDVNYIVGANASGKSNFLDAFRFLRDIAKPNGGGLQSAIADRGGLSKVRCLHSRKDPKVIVEVQIADTFEDHAPTWKYILAIKSEGSGRQRPVVASEEVYSYESGTEVCILRRPNKEDAEDADQLTETALEEKKSNKKFRQIAELFADTTYLHLVPQLIKFGDKIGGRKMESDPFGQGFMDRIANTPEKTRTIRLNRIQKALAAAIPQFEEIRFKQEVTGTWHLEAKYKHYRPNGSWQREDQFSDGTLRLISLFWLLLDGDGMLLLEEPELSLDEEIVRQFPRMIDLLYPARKKARRQTIISTHSSALLDNKSIDARFVLRLDQDAEATVIRPPSKEDAELIKSGFTPAEIVLAKVHPENAEKLEL